MTNPTGDLGSQIPTAEAVEVLGLADDPRFWRSARLRTVAGWLATFAALAALVGMLCGIFWWSVVSLPSYTVHDDFRAYTTERGLSEFFATDAWFAGLGLVVGIGVGIVAWRWFGDLGWPVVVVAVLGALVAGCLCWLIGTALGPGNFDVRLAAANPGDVVPIQFQLRSPVALLTWVFGGVAPILVLSALMPDREEPTAEETPSERRPRRRDAEDESGFGRDIDPLPKG